MDTHWLPILWLAPLGLFSALGTWETSFTIPFYEGGTDNQKGDLSQGTQSRRVKTRFGLVFNLRVCTFPSYSPVFMTPEYNQFSGRNANSELSLFPVSSLILFYLRMCSLRT